MEVSPEKRRDIISALRKGTVPQRGSTSLLLGCARLKVRSNQNSMMSLKVELSLKRCVANMDVAKTFFGRWVQEQAKLNGFATAEVQISETETPLHKLETVYRRAMEQLPQPTAFSAHSARLLMAGFNGLEEDVLAEGKIDPDDLMRWLKNQTSCSNNGWLRSHERHPSFSAALRSYRAAQRANDHATAEGLAGWLADKHISQPL